MRGQSGPRGSREEKQCIGCAPQICTELVERVIPAPMASTGGNRPDADVSDACLYVTHSGVLGLSILRDPVSRHRHAEAETMLGTRTFCSEGNF